MKNASGDLLFPTIGMLTTSFPHSNADVERLFSQVSLTKTKQRNSLKTSTVDALLMVRASLTDTTCVNFKPSTEICKNINQSMYCSDSSDIDE